MLYPVSVLVPTLYGRTSALLYDVAQAQAPHGVVLVEPANVVDPALERVCDEVSLYLRSAGISMLRLTSSLGVGPTNYAANILGSVALLREAGASRVVLIATAQHDAFHWTGGDSSDQDDSDEAAGQAFEGFLDLITTRATTPSEYAHLISELVDTIRDVIDAVVGVVHLTPSGTCYAPGRDLQHLEATAHSAVPRAKAAPQIKVGSPRSLLVAGAGSRDRVADDIAQLYSWVTYLLRKQETPMPSSARRTSLEDVRPKVPWMRQRLSETIWQALDPVWDEIVKQMVERKPQLASEMAEMDRLHHDPEHRARMYGRAWALFDPQARLDWLAACAQLFPLRGDRLWRMAGLQPPIAEGPDAEVLGLDGVG